MAGVVQSLRRLLPGLGGSVDSEQISWTDAFTWSGAQIHSALNTFTGGMTVSAGAVNFTGSTVTLPAGASLGAGSVLEANIDPITNNTLNVPRTAHYRATFATTGAGASPITMTGAALPNKALIRGGFLHVNIVPLTSTNMGITVASANDTIASAAISGAPWNAIGLNTLLIELAATASTWVKTANGTTVPALTYTGSAPTAYDIELFLDYVVVTV